MAIVDRNDPIEWRISEEVAVWVQNALKVKFLECVRAKEPTPTYAASGLIKGHLLVSCENDYSKCWLVGAVKSLPAMVLSLLCR